MMIYRQARWTRRNTHSKRSVLKIIIVHANPTGAASAQIRNQMSTIRSVFFYLALVLSTIVLGSIIIAVVLLTGRTDVGHYLAGAWGKVNLWAAGVTVKVKGLENIDPQGTYVFASNHESWFDIFTILGKLPMQFRWLAKVELFRIFILGKAMESAGYIPIDRSDSRKAFKSIDMAAERVKNGTSIVIFPEGTRSPDGVLQDFKKGGFILALKSQQPMVPISISGSCKILPKRGRWQIERAVIRMSIGKPIPTAGRTSKDRDWLMEAVRDGIRRNLPQSEGGIIPDQTKAALW
jgi:1-acyl-sn-glycerol-3-phosphate acyltransferase